MWTSDCHHAVTRTSRSIGRMHFSPWSVSQRSADIGTLCLWTLIVFAMIGFPNDYFSRDRFSHNCLSHDCFPYDCFSHDFFSMMVLPHDYFQWSILPWASGTCCVATCAFNGTVNLWWSKEQKSKCMETHEKIALWREERIYNKDNLMHKQLRLMINVCDEFIAQTRLDSPCGSINQLSLPRWSMSIHTTPKHVTTPKSTIEEIGKPKRLSPSTHLHATKINCQHMACLPIAS